MYGTFKHRSHALEADSNREIPIVETSSDIIANGKRSFQRDMV